MSGTDPNYAQIKCRMKGTARHLEFETWHESDILSIKREKITNLSNFNQKPY
jgi:hypothetical protein